MKRTSRTMLNRGSVVAAVMLGAALTMADGKAQAAATSDRAITDIHRYCTACWRNARLHPDSWGDCTQEVLARLLQSVPVTDWDRIMSAESDERREFVRAIDAVKKRTQRSRKYQSLQDDFAQRDPRGSQNVADERDLVTGVAKQVLSGRQQKILRMSFEGYSVQDMAKSLAMSPERVSDEKYKAVRKLRQHFGVDAA
jgi:RNA polymerase sigma factor (sigma-70 family)